MGLLGVLFHSNPKYLILELMEACLQVSNGGSWDGRGASFQIVCTKSNTLPRYDKDQLRDQGDQPFSTRDLLDKAMQCAAGMEYVHHHNILHCDLAARNILVSETGVRSTAP